MGYYHFLNNTGVPIQVKVSASSITSKWNDIETGGTFHKIKRTDELHNVNVRCEDTGEECSDHLNPGNYMIYRTIHGGIGIKLNPKG